MMAWAGGVRGGISSSGSLTYRLHCYYNENWQLLEGRKEVSGTEDTDPESIPLASVLHRCPGRACL